MFCQYIIIIHSFENNSFYPNCHSFLNYFNRNSHLHGTGGYHWVPVLLVSGWHLELRRSDILHVQQGAPLHVWGGGLRVGAGQPATSTLLRKTERFGDSNVASDSEPATNSQFCHERGPKRRSNAIRFVVVQNLPIPRNIQFIKIPSENT